MKENMKWQDTNECILIIGLACEYIFIMYISRCAHFIKRVVGLIVLLLCEYHTERKIVYFLLNYDTALNALYFFPLLYGHIILIILSFLHNILNFISFYFTLQCELKFQSNYPNNGKNPKTR